MRTHTDVAIIGAGFTGLSLAARLKRSGVHNFVLLDTTVPEVGTWREDTIRLFHLGKHLRLGHEVAGVAYDEVEGRWNVDIVGGEDLSVKSVVLATGSRSDADPDVPGVEAYTGNVVRGQEYRDVALAGKRVAVVGNGAAAATLLPEIVREAFSVKLFQSSPDWVLPRESSRIGRFLEGVPMVRDAARQAWFAGRRPRRAGILELLARNNLRRHVEDPWTRRQLTPLPLTGRPNVVVTDEFYTALQAPNCKLVTWPIARFSPMGIRTVEGIEHQCDIIVFASAPDESDARQIPVTGVGGAVLPESAAISVAGFPHLFQADPPTGRPGRDAVHRAHSRVQKVAVRVTDEVRGGPLGGVQPASGRTKAVAAISAAGLRPVFNRVRLNQFGVRASRQVVAGVMAAGSPMPADIRIARIRERDVRGEWVHTANGDPEGPIIFYIHGSGYVVCSPRTHRRLVARLSEAVGLPAFSLDYRLAPEHPFPAAAEDVRAAYSWLLKSGRDAKDIVIAGDSAGGHLAVDLIAENHRLGVPQPGALVVFSPLIDLTLGLSAERERDAPDPLISAAAARRLVDQYTRGVPEGDPRLRVTLDPGTVVPPTLIQVGGREMMVADAEHLELMIARAGGACELQVWPGQVHVFQALPRFSTEASAAVREAARFVTRALANQSHTTAAQSA
ncbi:alpha/beta hydrolase fold domain-containing protein [Mycobacterium sp. CBMA271]|uniref:alpha/beta hydrolase fold domain-containing protein n=1 Tax=unclassified Mycobacteroides TaxID=2618759 RepID=UPI0012DD535B|nr:MULTISPECIES: alpha/beta hydrolase fold domain-containing protein [unclassified Mycobacteroides]MUM19756.1 lipase [Mycobacteroides sp. CBMA 326]MUM21088.1 alpha/beta hydrolase fold domain-containing protein [Mycobacteroides sp. CBMA 271]